VTFVEHRGLPKVEALTGVLRGDLGETASHPVCRAACPTATISVRFVEDGKTVKSAFVDAAAPEVT
jgi:hypothetical protein